LDYTDRIKRAFTTNTGKPRLFCFLFQLKGKGSALSRGKSGMISILIKHLNFYPETSDIECNFLSVMLSSAGPKDSIGAGGVLPLALEGVVFE